MLHYRFYFLDESNKFIDFGEDDFPDRSLAVVAAQQRLTRRPEQVVEVWQQTKMIYRGKSNATAKTARPSRPERF